MDENGSNWSKLEENGFGRRPKDHKSLIVNKYSATMDNGRVTLKSYQSDVIEKYYDGELAINYSFRYPEQKKVIVVPLKILASWIYDIEEEARYDDDIRLYFDYLTSFLTPKFDAKQGRLVVPQSLREGRFEKDVIVVGRKDYLEIWDKETYDKVEEENKAKREKSVDALHKRKKLVV